MNLFNQRVAAFTWSKDGLCLAVLMVAQGSKFSVLGSFKGQASNPGAISATLEKAVLELELKDSDLILAGELGMGSTLFDLSLPQMKALDLQNSLKFSLSNHLPIDLNELNWAYRTLNPSNNANQHIRVIALKKSTWNQWLDHIGSLKVDLLASPAFVFDSIIQEPVFIRQNESHGFLLSRDDEDMLQIQNLAEDEIDFDCFGLSSLKHEKIDFNELTSRSIETQELFAQPILLALHGFSALLKSDKVSGLNIPVNSRPKRHTLSKNIVLFASVWLIMLGVFSLTNYLSKKNNHLKYIKNQTAQIEAQTQASNQETQEQLNLLRTELATQIPHNHSLLIILNTITEALPSTYYLKDFRLNNQRIDIRVLSSGGTVANSSELFDIFKNIPLFNDDVPVSTRGNEITISLTLAETYTETP